MTLACVGIWKSDDGASGTGQQSREGPAFPTFIYYIFFYVHFFFPPSSVTAAARTVLVGTVIPQPCSRHKNRKTIITAGRPADLSQGGGIKPTVVHVRHVASE